MNTQFKLVIIFSICVILAFCLVTFAKANQKNIRPETFLEIPQSERILVDVRTIAEYQAGFIPSAINMPLAQLPNSFTQLKDKDQQIVVYCRSGRRAGKAIKFLSKQGYTNIVHLEGDFLAWEKDQRAIRKP